MRPPRGHSRIEAGAFAAVIRSYLSSPKFQALAPSTQDGYRRYLLLAETPEGLGAVPVDEVRPALVQRFLDGLASRPGSQKNARVALKALERWAVVRDLLPFPITTGTEVIGGGEGHRPWSEAQIALAIQHARPEVARAITLGASTGQRRSDLIKMRWNDMENVDGRNGINVTQRKTGLQLWIPLTNALTEALATWDRAPGPILRKADGSPWNTGATLSMAWERERDSNPQLVLCRGMVLHGLRASACVRLRRLGATESQISDMVGLSVPMVARYCRQSAQKDNAMAAVHYLDGTKGRKRDVDAG